MPHRCPSWLGPLLLNPFRKLLENPEKMLGPIIREGMTVLEPGCGMGYFTIPIARMVGPRGKVVAVDIQPEMLEGLSRRAEKYGLSDRIEIRSGSESGMGLGDLKGTADLAVAIHMVHEVGDQALFFKEIHEALKEGGRFFIREPRFHVSKRDMDESVSLAMRTGFRTFETGPRQTGRSALLEKI